MLMFNSYDLIEQNEIFVIYTNNLSEKIMFSLNPYEKPQNLSNYQEEKLNWSNIDIETQNQIKKAIYETQHAENFETQMYFYIHTQMLIWHTFHPEISVLMGPEVGSFVGKLAKYQKIWEEKTKTKPEWIKDYELEKELTLPMDDSYTLSSKDCQIKEEEGFWKITDCNQESILHIKEKGEENIIFYTKEESDVIESGFSPCQYKIKLTVLKKEEPINPPLKEEEEMDTPVEETPSIEENTTTNENKTPNQVYVLENVPNTYEIAGEPKSIFLFLFFTVLWLKKQL